LPGSQNIPACPHGCPKSEDVAPKSEDVWAKVKMLGANIFTFLTVPYSTKCFLKYDLLYKSEDGEDV